MKKLLTILIISLLFISLFSFNRTFKATEETTAVVQDDGTVVTYRGSSEQVQRAVKYNYPTQRLRATWASCFVGSIAKFTSEEKWKEDFTYMLDTLEEYGLNCLVFHVRTHNNALYRSNLNPRATWFSAVDFDVFDPLEYAIEECHKRAIEFHAWLNPYRVLDSYCAEDYPSVNPASNSANILSNGDGKILDPGLPVVQQFLVDTCMELVENYDVDAIHFDDYFYISGVDDSATRAKYNTSNLSTGDFRRKSVDTFIENLSKSLRKYNNDYNKCVQLGIAPSGIYRNGGYVASPTYNSDGSLKAPLYSDTAGFSHYDDYLYADTLKWINNEWIDYMMPQAYWAIEHTAASYANLSRWWSWACRNRKVNLYMGIGYYMADSSGSSSTYWKKNTNEIRDQLLNAQLYDEIGGYCLYSYNYIRNSNKVIKTGMDLLKNDYNVVKIPCDEKQYYASVLPEISMTNVKYAKSQISWDSKDNTRGYIVYKVKKNTALNQKDISQVYYYGTSTSVTIDDPSSYTYYVASVNLANKIGPVVNTDALTASHTAVEDLINKLPDLITFNEEAALSKVIEFYNQIEPEEQALVSNFNVYLAKKAIYDGKVSALNEANNYLDINNYTLERRSIIRQEIAKFKQTINELPTVEEVNVQLVNLKELFDSYPTTDVELSPLRETSCSELDEFYNSLELEYYTKDTQSLISDDILDAKDTINSTNSSTEIKRVVKATKDLINSYANFKEEYLEKASEFRTYILDYSNIHSFDIYQEYYSSEVENLINMALKMDKGNFLSNYDTVVQTYENRVDNLYQEVNELVKLYNRSVKRIEAYSDDISGARELKDEYILKLRDIYDVDGFDPVVEEFKTKYAELGKENPEPIDPKPDDPTPEPKPDENKEKKDEGGLFDCNTSSIFLAFLSAMSLLFIFRKKH